jgi:hypothetical protein
LKAQEEVPVLVSKEHVTIVSGLAILKLNVSISFETSKMLQMQQLPVEFLTLNPRVFPCPLIFLAS